MSKVIASITTSVDGYITGPGDSPQYGLGRGGERLPDHVGATTDADGTVPGRLGRLGEGRVEVRHEPESGFRRRPRPYFGPSSGPVM